VGDGEDARLNAYQVGTVLSRNISPYFPLPSDFLSMFSFTQEVTGSPEPFTPGTYVTAASLANISGNVKLWADGNINFIGSRGFTYQVTDYAFSGGIKYSLQPWGGTYQGMVGAYTYNPAKLVLQKDTSLTVTAKTGQIWMPVGSSITATGTGQVSMDASSFNLQGNILTESGNISLTSQNGVDLRGATLKSTDSGTINITSSEGNISLNGSQIEGTSGTVRIIAYTGSMAATNSAISNSTGPISIFGQTGLNLWESTVQTETGSISFGSQNQIYLGKSTITSSGDESISIKADINQLTDSQIQSDVGRIYVYSQSYTLIEGPSSFIKSSATGDAVVISAAQYFYNGAGTNALQAPSGRWIVYLPSPQYLGNWAAPLNSANDAIWNTPLGTKLAPDKTGNRYVFASAPFVQVAVADRSKTYGQDLSGITLTQGADFTIVPVNGSGAYTIAASDMGSFTLKYSFPATSASGLVPTAPVGFYSNLGAVVATGSVTLSSVIPGTLTVIPALLTAGITNVSKVYDGKTTVGLGSNNFVLSGLVNGDSVGLINTPTSGVYATNSAGSGILVTANASTNLVLTGSLASNYILRTNGISGYGSITTASLSASLTGSVSKVYDATTTAALSSANYLLSGVIKGDAVSLKNASSGSFDSANAGSGKTVSVSGLALDNANYQLLSTSINGAIGTITPATLTASLTGSVSKVYDATTAATLTPGNYFLSGIIGTDAVKLNNPTSGTFDNANAGSGKSVSVTSLVLDNANYQLESTTINGSIGTITPATSTAQEILTEPTVQTAIQSLTIRNNTTTTSSGGSFGSSGPGSEGSGSGGESASAGETASSGESSSSESGGETASSESSGESGSSSESSTASTGSDSGSGSGSTTAGTASGDSSTSSGSSSTASSSSSSSSGGSASSSSGGSSQGAKAQAAAMSRMNNPVGGATVGGAEFQRLNPFSDAGAMHEEVAVSSASAGGSTQASTGRAAAVSVKSPEMTELAPMTDLNVLFMMF
jgi:hypothetical protein